MSLGMILRLGVKCNYNNQAVYLKKIMCFNDTCVNISKIAYRIIIDS